MGEVIEFKNIGYHTEQIVAFIGNRGGTLSLTRQEDEEDKLWMAMVSMPSPAGEPTRKTFSAESYNKLILAVRDYIRNEL